MKKKALFIIAGAAVIAAAGTVTYLNRSVTPEELLFRENVEALSEDESGGKDGALWSNAEGTRYCCGPGNVRDCDTTPVPAC